MTRTLLAAIFLTLFSQMAWAHKCILSGSTTEDITAYNTCKADLVDKTSGHEILELRNRIKSLETQLGANVTQQTKKDFILKCGKKSGSKLIVLNTFLIRKENEIEWIDSRIPEAKRFLPKHGGQITNTEFVAEYLFLNNGKTGLGGRLSVNRYSGAYKLSWQVSGGDRIAMPGYCEKALPEKLF